MTDFSARCPANTVILVDYAKYGRMKVGGCVKKDYGHINCSVDVTSYLDQRCSGREQCRFKVTDLAATKPCPEDLTPYLEANYSCTKGRIQHM